MIIDPSVRGTITVRSYDMLNEEQYYQFFLSVLDVYGFAVINMNNGVLKVVPRQRRQDLGRAGRQRGRAGRRR